ncbi:unnamed protein product, partial [Cuscuta campestris]
METILSLRFFIFQYGTVYKLHLQGDNTSLTVCGFSWIVFAVLLILFKVFTFSQKISVNFQLLLRFVQGLSFLLALAGLATAVALTDLSIADVFACILAFIPTGWGILCVSRMKTILSQGMFGEEIRYVFPYLRYGVSKINVCRLRLLSGFPPIPPVTSSKLLRFFACSVSSSPVAATHPARRLHPPQPLPSISDSP